jgi:hypothetical protein
MMAPFTDSRGRLMLNAKIVDCALPAMKSIVLKVMFPTETAGDRSISMHDNVFVTYLNIAALDVDVLLNAEGDTTSFICCDLEDTLTVIAIGNAIDRLNGNGGTTVWALAGNGRGHNKISLLKTDTRSQAWFDCDRSPARPSGVFSTTLQTRQAKRIRATSAVEKMRVSR